MRVRSTTAVAPFAALLLGAALTSCSGQEETDTAHRELERAATALTATALRPGAERAFERHDHPLGEGLSCTTHSHEHSEPTDGEQQNAEASEDTSGNKHLMVHCTGRTEDGEDALFEGRLLRATLAERAADDDSLQGSFTGHVGGTEVFSMDCLQCSPEPTDEDTTENAEDAGDPDGAGTAGD